jgi:hypothetical protein
MRAGCTMMNEGKHLDKLRTLESRTRSGCFRSREWRMEMRDREWSRDLIRPFRQSAVLTPIRCSHPAQLRARSTARCQPA